MMVRGRELLLRNDGSNTERESQRERKGGIYNTTKSPPFREMSESIHSSIKKDLLLLFILTFLPPPKPEEEEDML